MTVRPATPEEAPAVVAALEWLFAPPGATHLELDSGDARTDAHRFYERERPATTSRCFGYAL